MAKVFFSSWNGKFIDGRKNILEERLDLQQLDIPSQLDGKELRAFIGWAGLIIVDPEVNLVAALKEYFRFVQKESCGRCIPCRIGSKVIADRLEKIVEGNGTEDDLSYLREIGKLVKESSLCELGMSAPLPLLQALDEFKEDFYALLSGANVVSDQELVYHPILTAPCRNGCSQESCRNDPVSGTDECRCYRKRSLRDSSARCRFPPRAGPAPIPQYPRTAHRNPVAQHHTQAWSHR